MARKAVIALAALLTGGCEGPGDFEPSFVTPSGVKVWVFGRPVAPELVDEAFHATFRELPHRWPRQEHRSRVLAAARLVLLETDAYELEGRLVAGHVHPLTHWIYVAGGTRPVAETALVHEIVHYLDLAFTGTTDETHASWQGEVYEAVARVNAHLREKSKEASASNAR